MHSDNSVRIMAHGDLLYHLPILRGAEQPDGSYDFSENFTYVKPWIEQADFAIADFEGTISPDIELAGYPLLMRLPLSPTISMMQATIWWT